MTAKSVATNYDNISNEFDNKAKTFLDNISTLTSLVLNELTDAYLDNTFTIIYPYGTEENPGILQINKAYTIPNPFPGYYVEAQVEVYYTEAKQWGTTIFHGFYTTEWYGCGSYIFQHNDGDLVLKTGQRYVLPNYTSGTTAAAHECRSYPSSFSNLYLNIPTGVVTTTHNNNIPFRIKVRKIGKIPS